MRSELKENFFRHAVQYVVNYLMFMLALYGKLWIFPPQFVEAKLK
jgi:hypothetical protein